MARPTSDKKDYKIILRVNGETRSKIEDLSKKNGCSLSDCVRDIISKPNNSVLQINSDINTGSESYTDLKGMVEFFGMTMDDFIQQADVALSEGVLTISDGKLVCVIPEWAQRLSDACHELGYDVERIAESAVKSLGKGML